MSDSYYELLLKLKFHGERMMTYKKLCNDMPATYQIRVQGILTESWSDWLGGVTITSTGQTSEAPVTTLSGRLIDQAGLKGETEGDASVSDIHGNFIVNRGNARSADVLALINRIKEKVYEKYEIDLELEVEIIDEP